MIAVHAMVSSYGYAAIAAGTFFEGETILILAGLAAHRGYLKLPWVIIFGFLGTLAGDQFYFYLGRIKGTKLLEHRPYWKLRADRVFALLRKNRLLLTLGFRFLYGLRTITPFLLGAGGISPIYFLVMNVIGALLWAVAIGVSGYLFGQAFQLVVGPIERYELFLFVGLAVAGVMLWCGYWFRRARRAKKPCTVQADRFCDEKNGGKSSL